MDFEQDARAAIEQIIREDVRADIYGDLYGVDRAAEDITVYIMQLQSEIKTLKARLENRSWDGYVDRQGGSFTEQEINDANTWR